MAHTPGPWIVEPHSDEDETLYVCANYTLTPEGFARATWIAECDLQDGNLEENGANARLIAAAPELLAALKFWVQVFDLTATDSYCEACQWHAPKDDDGHIIGPINHQVGCPYLHARSAIAKAEGR